MLEQLAYAVVRGKLFAALPDAFAHHEVRGFGFLGRLDAEAVQQTFQSDIHIMIQVIEEAFLISGETAAGCRTVGKAQTHEVQRVEGQIAFAGAVIASEAVAEHTGAAAHGCKFRVRIGRIVILQVERRIQIGEVRIQSARRAFSRFEEQLIVRIALLLIDALLALEDLNREHRCFTAAEAVHRRSQQGADDQLAFRRSAGAVVDARKRNLPAGAAGHRI
ncbi:hypothetical protein D3C75_756640 [compost metagenome]